MYEILDNEKNCDIFSPKEYIIKISFYLLCKFNLNKNYIYIYNPKKKITNNNK